MVKNLPAKQEMQVQSLSWEDPLEKEMTTHSSTLAWEIPWTGEPGRLQSVGSESRTELTTTMIVWASLVAQSVKNLPAVQETWVQSLSWEDRLEDGMATHPSILA